MKPCIHAIVQSEQDSKPLGLIIVGDKSIGTLNDSEEWSAKPLCVDGCSLVTIWGLSKKDGDPENPRVYHEYPFKRDYCIPLYSSILQSHWFVLERWPCPHCNNHWASDRGRGVGLLFLGQRQSGVYQPGLRVHRLAGECRREAQTMEWMLPEFESSQWLGWKEGVYPLVICYSLLLNMAIYFVSFPMKNGGSFHSYVAVYQRVSLAVSVDWGWKPCRTPLPGSHVDEGLAGAQQWQKRIQHHEAGDLLRHVTCLAHDTYMILFMSILLLPWKLSLLLFLYKLLA